MIAPNEGIFDIVIIFLMEWFPEAKTKLKKIFTLDRVRLLGFLFKSTEELEANLVMSLSDVKSCLIVLV